MSLKLGNTDINKIYLGSTEIKKIYLGSTVVYDKTAVAAFRFQIDTEKAGSGTTVFIAPVVVGTAGLSGTMNWGDGNSTFLDNTSIAADFEHDYGVGNEGIYDCFFVGDMKGWRFNNLGDKEKITKLTDWTGFFIEDAAFQGCTNLVITATTIPIVVGVTLAVAFRNNTSMGSPDFSGFDTSAINFMTSTFRDNGPCGVNIAGWSMSQVSNMNNFADSTTFTTANYDAFLIATDAQGAMSFSGTFNAGGSKYTSGGAAETARTSLISKWGAIVDGGAA